MKRSRINNQASSQQRGALLFAAVLGAAILVYSAVNVNISDIYGPVNKTLLAQSDA